MEPMDTAWEVHCLQTLDRGKWKELIADVLVTGYRLILPVMYKVRCRVL